MASTHKPIPCINVGKYKGTPIDQLPVSYCRWMLGQNFPREWLDIVKAKVEASPLNGEPLNVSRHAIDRFSLRFHSLWVDRKDKSLGLATLLVKHAEMAWKKGSDVSKNRHQDDGIVKEYNGIKFVFNQSKTFPEYLELITVM